MLTPAEIDAFNKATGGAVPLNASQTGGTAVKSRADRMLEIGKEVEASNNPVDSGSNKSIPGSPVPVNKGTVSNIGEEVITGIKNLQAAGDKRGKAMAQPIADYKSGKQPDLVKAIGATAEQVISQTAGGIADTFAEVVKRSGSFILNSLGVKPQVKKQAAAFVDYLAKSPIAPGVVDSTYGDVANHVAQKAKEYAAAHPEFATHAETVGNIVNAYLSVTGFEQGTIAAGKMASKASEIVAPVVKPTLDAAGNIIEKSAVAAGENLGKVKTVITDTVSNLKTKIKGGKTLEEVLATAEKDLPKLSAAEREAYFKNQKTDITAKSAATQAKVDADLAKKSQASIEEAKALQKELQTVTRDKVIELRPKAREALGKQSQEYRRLVDEEIAKVADTKVGHKEVGKFIDQKYAADEQMAEALKERLGLTTRAVTDPQTTLGELYDQTKSLGQDIGTAAKKGVRTFTPDEKLTDDAISTLVDYMKSKGVDLSKARQFWAQYAPVRNQLVSEGKIFLQSDTQTKTLGNTLSRVARETDVHAENFINQVEDLVGQPITTEAKAVVAKLDANAKAVLADKIAAELLKDEAKMAADKALQALSAKEFEVARLARRRNILINVIKALPGIYVGDKILKSTTGIGF